MKRYLKYFIFLFIFSFTTLVSCNSSNGTASKSIPITVFENVVVNDNNNFLYSLSSDFYYVYHSCEYVYVTGDGSLTAGETAGDIFYHYTYTLVSTKYPELTESANIYICFFMILMLLGI